MIKEKTIYGNTFRFIKDNIKVDKDFWDIIDRR